MVRKLQNRKKQTSCLYQTLFDNLSLDYQGFGRCYNIYTANLKVLDTLKVAQNCLPGETSQVLLKVLQARKWL